MSVNLLNESRGFFNNQLVTKASSFLQESETGITKAITGILPTLFQQLVNKSFTHEGAGIIAQMVNEEQHSAALNNIEEIFNNDKISQKGTRFLNRLFDNKLTELTALLSNFSGLTTSSVTALLSIAVQAVLGIVGKYSGGGASGIATLISNQKDDIAFAMPGGLNSCNVLGGWNAETHIVTVQPTIVNEIPVTVENYSSINILLSILILVMAALAVFYLLA